MNSSPHHDFSIEADLNSVRFYVLAAVVLAGIALVSYVNFLLFHVIVELFSGFTACAIFIFSWNTRHFAKNNYLLFLGIIYLFVGLIDFAHTVTYEGMGIVNGYDANLPTQLWIGARYLESISLAVAPIYFNRTLNYNRTLQIYLVLVVAFFLSVFVWPVFPACYVPGQGLTWFKVISEYVISLFLLVATVILYLKRQYMSSSVFVMIICSMVLTILSEIFFTFYISTYGISNIVGHLLKLVSFYLIYRAVIVTTLTTPYESLFNELVASEQLREKYIRKLEKAVEEIKTLQGIIPICSYCKKIRNDRGAWEILEAYISKHSDAQFSHGVCPDCLKRELDAVEEPRWQL